MVQTKDPRSVYQFYYNPFSICSLFVLYTLELKGKPKSASENVDPERCFIDISTNEQMSEEFLEKNPKGQVSSSSFRQLELSSLQTRTSRCRGSASGPLTVETHGQCLTLLCFAAI